MRLIISCMTVHLEMSFIVGRNFRRFFRSLICCFFHHHHRRCLDTVEWEMSSDECFDMTSLPLRINNLLFIECRLNLKAEKNIL
jgi:hypothetical protein